MVRNPKFPEFRFVRRLTWKESEEGRIIVFRPRFGESRWAKSLSKLFGLSDYKIRLDDIGTAVWKLCDGETPARKIAKVLHERFGEKVKPADERLETFVLQMERARMIEIRVPEG